METKVEEMRITVDKGGRLWALDALRGLDMLFISGLAGTICELTVLVCGSSDAWLAKQMSHVEWVGFRHHDTIFPLFIFLSGVAYPFSFAAARARGLDAGEQVWKATKRLLALVALGLVYNGILQLDFAHQRWASVLARIGMAWYGSALLYLFVRSVRARLAVAAGLLVGYWAVCFFLTAPDAPVGASSFSVEGCFAGYVDRLFLPGRFAGKGLDAEGLLSVFPAIVLAMGGVFAGELVRRESPSGGCKTLLLAGIAAALAGLTWVWMPWCPIIKKIWTPTFVTASLAYSFACFALFYWIVDVLRFRRWTFFFRVIGMNALTVYLFRRVVPVSQLSQFFFGGVIGLFPATCAAFLSNVAMMAVIWLFFWFLYKKNVFLKV